MIASAKHEGQKLPPQTLTSIPLQFVGHSNVFRPKKTKDVDKDKDKDKKLVYFWFSPLQKVKGWVFE